MAPSALESEKGKRERKSILCKLHFYTNLSKNYYGAGKTFWKTFWKIYFFFFIMEYGSRIIYNLGCNAPGMVNSGYKQVISTMMSSLSTLFEVIIEIFSPLWVLYISTNSHRYPSYKQTQRYKHTYGQALIKLAPRPKFDLVHFEEFWNTNVTNSDG